MCPSVVWPAIVRGDLGLLALFSLVVFALLLVAGQQSGIFRDELYYIACANRLAWGYVDHPPLSIALLAAVRATLGESLLALRLPAALAGATTVFLSGLIARALGGGRGAMLLAALAVAITPQLLAMSSFYSMNALELVAWALLELLAIRILAGGSPRLWLAFGVVAGLGLLDKYSVALLRRRPHRRHAVHRAAAPAADAVAVAGRGAGAAAVRPAPVVGAGQRLADAGIHGQRHRPQERAPERDRLLRRPADAQPSAGGAAVDRRSDRPADGAPLRRPTPARHRLPDRLRPAGHPGRQGLLPVADLPDAVRRRRGVARSRGASPRLALAGAGHGRRAADRRYRHRTAGGADAAAGAARALCGGDRPRSAGDGAQQARGAAAACRRPLRLAGAGGCGRRRRRSAVARGSRPAP